jgi:phage virion morphogenesis protein
MAFTYELKIDELTPALADAIRRLDRPRDLMAAIARQLVDTTETRFQKGESPDGVKWAPKSAVTLAAYGARKSNRVDVRPLFGPSGSLSSTINRDSGDDFAEVGSPMKYAAAMQFGAAQGAFGTTSRGGPIPWGNIPARPFLGFSDEDRRNILEAIADHLGPAFRPA